MTHAAIVQIFHEANAFAHGTVSYEDVVGARTYRGEAARSALLGSKNWVAGVASGLVAAGDDVHFGLCASARPGGPLERSAFERLKCELVDSLTEILAHQPLDRVALLLHGALGVEGMAQPETAIARSVRELVGEAVPILVTLDFHANIESGLLDVVDLVIGGKLYPHTDTFERGERLIALSTEPPGLRTLCFQLPILTPIGTQSTDLPHMAELVELTEQLARQPGIADVGFMGGFPYADTNVVGSSVLVTGRDPEAMVEAFRTVAAAVWDRRTFFRQVPPTFGDIADEVFAAARKGRVVIGDVGDNPGSGGQANQADILAALATRPEPFVAGFVVDGDAVMAAAALGEGRRGIIPVGRLHSGEPLRLDAFVERVGDVRYRNEGANMRGELMVGGPGAVLRVGGAGHVAIVTERLQAFDTAAFRSQGIDIDSKAVIYLKSANHFRTAFAPVATGGMFFVDEGGCASTNIHRFNFMGRARDILPLTQLDHAQWQRYVDDECARILQNL